MMLGVLDSGVKYITSNLKFYIDASQLRSYPGSGTTWSDVSGNADDATLTNGPTYSSVNGGVIVFDDSNDYGVSTSTTNTNVNSTTGYTFGAWVYPTFTTSQLQDRQIQAIVCSRANSTSSDDFTIAFGLVSNAFGCGVYLDRKLFLRTGGGGNNVCSSNKFDWNNNAWNHIVVTHVGTGANAINMYANGVSVLSTTGFTVSSNTSIKYHFGQSCNTSQIKFVGRMAINHVYDRALSATEVLQNYNATKSRFGL
jgi:hypothetical protein